MYVSRLRLIVAGLATASALGIVGAGTAWAVQLHMANARADLQQGLTQLQLADPDKGGHRDQAISLVQQAINQVDAGIQYADGS
jgi:hypothetical protein